MEEITIREEELVKTLKQIGKESTWCRTCLRRDKCDIKETVAMEQKLVVPYPVKYVDVKIKCRNYIKDSKLPDRSDVFASIFSV